MKISLRDKFPITLVFFWAITSVLELVTYYNARYLRLGILCVLLAEFLFVASKRRFYKGKFAIGWLLSLVVVTYSVLHNLDITNAEYLITYVFSVLLLIIPIYNFDNIAEQICKLVKIAAIFHGIGVIGQKIFPWFFNTFIYTRYPEEMYNRLSSATYHTGFQREVAVTSAYLIAGLGVFLYASKRKRSNTFWVIFLLLALIITNKRAFIVFPILAIIVEMLIFQRAEGKIKTSRKRVLQIAAGIGIAMVAIVVFWSEISQIPIVGRLMETISALEAGEDASTGRNVLWAASWQLFLTQPILGIGWRNTETYIRLLVYSSVELSTHNVYLQLLTETGIIGALIFGGAFIFSIKHFYKTYKRAHRFAKESDERIAKVYFGLTRCATYYQVFFLLYCITGCNLQERAFMIFYFVSIFITKEIDRNISNIEQLKARDDENETIQSRTTIG